ncbi:hypothetical protein B1M25_11725 [Salmonella enterica subsp. enterica serovar Dublin]|nr:hypothetical protein B1M25_11725 [Salmonella enterica subsp. enterica serovar Dublin]
MTEITLKNDLKQKSRDRVTVKPADFASQISFLRSQLKKLINILEHSSWSDLYSRHWSDF